MVCCHTGALFALKLSALPGIMFVLLASLIIGSLMGFFRNAQLTSPKRIQSITIGQQHCVLKFAATELVTELPKLEYFSEYLILLRFNSVAAGSGERRIRLLLLADSLTDDEDRRLRRFLRFDAPRKLN